MAALRIAPMAGRPNGTQRGRRSFLRVCALCAAAAFLNYAVGQPFTVGAWESPRLRQLAVALHAEESAPAPAPAPSSALVKVSEESKMSAASLIGGLAGLWFGGALAGAGLFVAISYLTRSDKNSDISKALTGVSEAGIDAVNYVAGLEDKYKVTEGISTSVNNALENAKANPDTKEVASTVSGALKGAGEAISSFDEEVKIKDTIGGLATSASELTYKATTSVGELNEKYKVTETIKEKIDEVTKK